MKEIIIDTDIGGDIDDLLSIAMAIRSPELQIMGITTVGLYSDRRAKIARGLLDLNGLQHIPVAAGASKPLSKEWEFREYPNQYGDEIQIEIRANASIQTPDRCNRYPYNAPRWTSLFHDKAIHQ